jgi:glycerate 2-kinase
VDRRQLLLSVFHHALSAVRGRPCVRAALAEAGSSDVSWRVIAIGKAAASMTLGALDALGARITDALIVTRSGHVEAELAALDRVLCLESAHPTPDARSLAAGAAVLDRIASTRPRTRLLFLISGGASSLVEVLRPGVSLDALVEVNRWALASGLDIKGVNALRKRLSHIKGGGLLARLAGRDALALYISDVPGDEPQLIGSGLLCASTAEPLPGGLPAWLLNLVSARDIPAVHDSAHVEHRIVASLADAVARARAFALSQGFRTRAAPDRFAGEASELASRFCHELALSEAQLHIWGGESIVRLPAAPGAGGRNQHLALAAARLLVAHDELMLLAAGTDGSDGTTDDAGALVDSETIERGTVGGFDADDCLARADSAAFLEASGDLLHTGPTGTNVGDLVLGLKGPA